MYDDGEGAVVALLHRYALACDERDFDALRACFTPDATAEYSGVRLEAGVDHIVEHLQGLRGVPLTQHVVGTVVVDVTGSRARATSYTTVHLLRAAGEGHEVVHRGVRYDDELVRTDAGWRIRERVHRVLWSTAQPTVWPVPPF
jgi:3-phenylpropionate/cinnamic acid dioxygenase small subunit